VIISDIPAILELKPDFTSDRLRLHSGIRGILGLMTVSSSMLRVAAVEIQASL
jgi:hypothetical protein